jgi:hypothetical protein
VTASITIMLPHLVFARSQFHVVLKLNKIIYILSLYLKELQTSSLSHSNKKATTPQLQNEFTDVN